MVEYNKFEDKVLELETSLRKINILLKERILVVLKDFEITPSQFRTLIIIKKYQKTSMKNIVEKMHRKPPTATGIIDRLVKKKLVERSDSKKDRRIVNAELTDKGKKMVNKVRKKSLSKLQSDIKEFSKQELNEFIKLLNKFRKSVEKTNDNL